MKIPVKVYEELNRYWVKDLIERGVLNEDFMGEYVTERVGNSLYLVTTI